MIENLLRYSLGILMGTLVTAYLLFPIATEIYVRYDSQIPKQAEQWYQIGCYQARNGGKVLSQKDKDYCDYMAHNDTEFLRQLYANPERFIH